MLLDKPMNELEQRIMSDIIRRIRQNGEITRAADWQISRLYQLGVSYDEIDAAIAQALGLSDKELEALYSGVISKGYARDKGLYDKTGVPFIPFEENEEIRQLISSVAEQTGKTLKNITGSLGFAVNTPGGISFLPIAKYYQRTLDDAMLDIASGAFDYNTVLKRVVSEMTNSGLRTVDYASGHSNRVEVAARRALQTGIGQLADKVNNDNAKALDTDYFEVTVSRCARPSHAVWQGRVYSSKDLVSVCGYGRVDGLCGANCHHDKHPFIPGISQRAYTDEELDEIIRQENTPREWNGKQYTAYEATQRQRRLETTMRAQRQKIKLLEEGGADEDTLTEARARYRTTSAEYSRFSNACGIPQQRERVTVDGLGAIGNAKKPLTNGNKSGIIKIERERSISNDMKTDLQMHTAAGNRRSPLYVLTDSEIDYVKSEIKAIGADEKQFVFNSEITRGTCFLPSDGKVHIKGNVFPDLNSDHPRDRMSVRAVLAHEYYGHRPYCTQYLKEDNDTSPDALNRIMSRAWADEFRASYMAAKNAPNLTDEDRMLLIRDSITRAEEAGVTIKYNSFIRRVLYG